MPDKEQNIQRPIVEGQAITASRFVVFLDILGFKDKVAHKEHGSMLEKLKFFQGNLYY